MDCDLSMPVSPVRARVLALQGLQLQAGCCLRQGLLKARLYRTIVPLRSQRIPGPCHVGKACPLVQW